MMIIVFKRFIKGLKGESFKSPGALFLQTSGETVVSPGTSSWIGVSVMWVGFALSNPPIRL